MNPGRFKQLDGLGTAYHIRTASAAVGELDRTALGRAPVGPDNVRSRGAIAQLGERWLCKPEVAGSIPAGSIT